MELLAYRKEIDAVDNEITAAIIKRLKIAEEIGALKAEQKLPITVPERERQLLARLSVEAGEDYAADIRIVYNLLLGMSRSHQYRSGVKETLLAEKLDNALNNTSKIFPESAFVACQGIEGAYSQQACDKLFAAANIMYVNSFEGVFNAVDKGLCKYGVLPLENSSAGSVNKIYDLMRKYKFSIVRSTRLHVAHVLAAKPGTKIADIKHIYSHEQALRQCSDFIDLHKDFKVEVCENTAMAAQNVANSEQNDIAAICSAECAKIYGLQILEDRVHNADNNYTRFICIAKETEIYPGADRTSLMMIISHKPGSLYSVIARIYSLGINIIKLESRPIPERDFEFMFYFDIEVSVYSDKFRNLLLQLQAEVEDFQYLGSYSEII